jgi:hypothetical protein
MPRCRHFALALGLALIVGCATEVPIGQPDVREQDVLDTAAQLRVTVATRDQARAVLGEPLLADERSGAEVFRVSGKQRQVALFFVPYPIPMPFPSQDQEGYTLVTYDESGVVTGVDAGFTTSETFGPTRHLVLRAGDYEFLHARSDLLLVTQERYLRDRAATTDATSCTLLVGCERKCPKEAFGDSGCGVCWTRLQADGGPAQDLPLIQWVAWWLGTAGDEKQAARETFCRELGGELVFESCTLLRRVVVPLRFAPGSHRLRATIPMLDGEVSGEFSCTPGELVFATLAGDLTERYSLAKGLAAGLKNGAASGSVTFSREPPPALQDQRAIVSR